MTSPVLSSVVPSTVPTCPVCLSEVTIPARLSCGHVMDFACIGRWINTRHSTCPLDMSTISVVSLANIEPAKMITFRFPGIDLPFYAHVSVPISSLVETYAVCKNPSLTPHLTPILSKIPGLSDPPDEASRFVGKVKVSKIESIDLIEESLRPRYFYGNFPACSSSSLEAIGIVAGSQLTVRAHTVLSWDPTA